MSVFKACKDESPSIIFERKLTLSPIRETSQVGPDGNIIERELGADGTLYIVEFKSLGLRFLRYYQGGLLKVHAPLPAQKELLHQSIQGQGGPDQTWFRFYAYNGAHTAMGTSVTEAAQPCDATALRYMFFHFKEVIELVIVLYEIFERDISLVQLFFAEKSLFTIPPNMMNRANYVVPAFDGMEAEYAMSAHAPKVFDDDNEYEWDNNPTLQSQAY